MELPTCWSYCLASELACVGSADLAQKACAVGVAVRSGAWACHRRASALTRAPPLGCQAGRVAPDRPDVRCMSCASRAERALLLLLLRLAGSRLYG